MGKHEDYEPPYLAETVIVDLTIFPGIDHIYRIGDGTLRHVESPKRRNKHRLTDNSFSLNSKDIYFDAAGTLIRHPGDSYLSVGRDLNVGDEFKKAR